MSSSNFPLSNKLIEGFLYEFLSDWKSLEEIFIGILKRFGEEMCIPSVKSKNGQSKYQHKTEVLLFRGLKNNIYENDAQKSKYRRI